MSKPQIDTTFVRPSCAEEMPLGPSAAAGILVEGNAGWRTQRPVVDPALCVRCMICWTICPDGVIDRDISIDMNFCKGCGLCAHECPRKAITMVREGDAQ